MSRPMIEERTFSDIAGTASARYRRVSGAYSWRRDASLGRHPTAARTSPCRRLGSVTRSQQSLGSVRYRAREPERDLALGGLVARRCAWTRFSVVVVAKSPRIVPGCGVVDLGRADQRAHQRERVVGRALDHHREHRGPGEEGDELAVEAACPSARRSAPRPGPCRRCAARRPPGCRPLRSRRPTISPTRPRSTASGLHITKVRFMARTLRGTSQPGKSARDLQPADRAAGRARRRRPCRASR